ncbi:MAG: alpha/beta hydrolase [Actinobacteria bacterium]|nr:alpha/beta hydrolase [Actinomycetota bacterium]
MTRRVRLAAAAAAGTTAALAVLERRDRRAVAADPQGPELAAPLAGRPTRVRSADGTELHVEVFGPRTGPTVVLVHGWMCSMELWRRQIRDLSCDHRVVAYDLRGHGRSGPAAGGDHSSDALAADLAAVLDRVGDQDERVVLAGHSMGAMGIVAWAGANPDDVVRRVAGVVLADTGVEELIGRARLVVVGNSLSQVRLALGTRLLGWPFPLPGRPRALASRAVRAIAMAPGASPALLAFTTRMLLATPTEARTGFGGTLSTLDVADGLHTLDVPAVVLVGEHDRLTPPVHAHAIAEGLPDATLIEVPDAGHMAPLEAPAAVTGAIRTLVGRTLASPDGRT